VTSEGAEAIRAGKLVAFPTETVYGLGANALDPIAVERIFLAKGRPKTSPLIVHVASIEMARRLSRAWPAAAEALAQRFWPGPLTLIVPKASLVPDEVTAGLDSVGLRMPDHPIALELIQKAGVPIAAPSANKFTELSPTTAAHVRASFGPEMIVLDGGHCRVGIESTVFHVEGLRILRPGMISRAQIEDVVGPVREENETAGPHLSPGQHARHYQPRTRLLLTNVLTSELPAGRGAYLWTDQEQAAALPLRMPSDPDHYAAVLYSTLHDLDRQKFDWIVVQNLPDDRSWDGIRDRLARAAATT
jgi:L-threonylcarbamoyladenylate synthase